MEKRIYFISLGCPKNLADTEKIAYLMKDKFRLTNSINSADTVLISTCAFTREARIESYKNLALAGNKYLKNKLREVIVTGCLPVLEKTKIKARYPFIKFLDISGMNLHTEEFSVLSDRVYSYLKISEGCNRRCSFCLIPEIKGKFVPYNTDMLLRQAIRLSANGIKELIIVSQCTTDYPVKKLKVLLKNILSECDFCRVRLLYLHPDSLSDDFFALFDLSEKILKYFDIPFQHSNSRILELMGRRKKEEEFIKLIKKIKKYYPAAVLRSNFIVGFPGETEREFRHLSGFIRTAGIDYTGLFKYTGYPSLASEKVKKDAISEKVKNERYKKLVKIVLENIIKFNKKLLGKTYEALPCGKYFRLWQQAPNMDGITVVGNSGGAGNNKFQDMIKIKITGINGADLSGIKI